LYLDYSITLLPFQGTQGGVRYNFRVTWNKADCFIEIIYDSPQTIAFENAQNFSIENADRILYNADKNILYWGNSGYQSCLDYTKLDEDLHAHKEEILDGYKQLPTLIDSCFRP